MASLVKGELLCQSSAYLQAEVAHIAAADLMSDVLVMDHDNLLLVTCLASEQVIRTAHIVGAVGVVIAGGKNLPSGMKPLAREMEITLIRTALPKFETCVALGRCLVPA